MKKFLKNHKQEVLSLSIALFVASIPMIASAAGTGGGNGALNDAFQPILDMLQGALTGTMGRTFAIVAGLVGLGIGAFKGSAALAVPMATIAVAGAMGPTIVDALFESAII